MVKHVILWTLKNEYSKEEKEAIKAEIKAGLEGLAGQIPGLLEIHVNINGLESSNADLMLDSTYTDEAALKGYSVHPAHATTAAIEKNFPKTICVTDTGDVKRS